jgi:hypothetical protein
MQVAPGSIILPMTGSVVNISLDNQEQPVTSKSLPTDELTPVSTGFFNTCRFHSSKDGISQAGDEMGAPQVTLVDWAFADRFFN